MRAKSLQRCDPVCAYPLHHGPPCRLILCPQAITKWKNKGTLQQYLESRSCKNTVDAADNALRGALQRLAVRAPPPLPQQTLVYLYKFWYHGV